MPTAVSMNVLHLRPTDISQDAFEKADVASESDAQSQGSAYVPPGSGRPVTGQETRV